MLTDSDLTALPFIVLMSLGAPLVSREVEPRSWPRALMAVPVGLVGWLLLSKQRMADNFVVWLGVGPSWPYPLFLAAGVAGYALLRRRGVPVMTAGWVACASLMVAVTTLSPAWYQLPGGLLSCIEDVRRFVPVNRSQLLTDTVPNIALFAPLGLGFAALGWRTVRVALVAAALSAGVELWQAFATHRVCAPRDVWANVLGAVLGALALRLLSGRRERRPAWRSPAPRSSPPPTPTPETLRS